MLHVLRSTSRTFRGLEKPSGPVSASQLRNSQHGYQFDMATSKPVVKTYKINELLKKNIDECFNKIEWEISFELP